jgi:hypothetical protein
MATYNDFERRFAQFPDQAPDVLRFASLGTTEQAESWTQFRMDYLKPSGAIGFYYPDIESNPTSGRDLVKEIPGSPSSTCFLGEFAAACQFTSATFNLCT